MVAVVTSPTSFPFSQSFPNFSYTQTEILICCYIQASKKYTSQYLQKYLSAQLINLFYVFPEDELWQCQCTEINVYFKKLFKHRLRVFENSVLQKITGPMKEETTGSLRKLKNEEIHDSYSSPKTIRMSTWRIMRCTWHGVHMRKKRRHWGICAKKWRTETTVKN